MIFGITLKHFERLILEGKNAKNNRWINFLLTRTSKRKIKTIDISQLNFGLFVDLERYFEEQSYFDFCSIFVKSKFIYAKHLSSIMLDYGEQKKSLFEQYKWIFDPPQFGEAAAETQGSELRREFVEEFGNYAVLTDVICQHQKVSYLDVEKWTLEQFLFWANYYSAQKIIENVK